MYTAPKEKRGTVTVPRNFRKENSLYGKTYTNESRKLRQARPKIASVVDLPRETRLLLPHGIYYLIITQCFCLVKCFFSFRFIVNTRGLLQKRTIRHLTASNIGLKNDVDASSSRHARFL